ncbi:uncharacterized protein E0L32_005670 [Thyridium curvatum]|uniref:Altered inheritance of mitochondria protein 11 n=1 Tax=Thyridium curvatum TaxID=1093900 RepID=A0A507BBI5_9PEZI|nr:uncharacterized protein E0L32_005670 [Thyridium curvatum]TPX13970.1 hypothetical protein E0L32_005670 [Thyridium curvatum]
MAPSSSDSQQPQPPPAQPQLYEPQQPPAQQQQQPPSSSSSSSSSLFSTRTLKQLGVFFVGAGFLTWSTLLARRAVRRRTAAAYPKLFDESYLRPDAAPRRDPDGPLIALEALNLATLSVLSWGIMMTGGLAFAFDVSSAEEMRARARAQLLGMGPDGDGSGKAPQTEEEAEREVQEFLAKVYFRRKDDDDGEGAGAGEAASELDKWVARVLRLEKDEGKKEKMREEFAEARQKWKDQWHEAQAAARARDEAAAARADSLRTVGGGDKKEAVIDNTRR